MAESVSTELNISSAIILILTAVGAWGAKLEALGDTLRIFSSQTSVESATAVTDPRAQGYELKPRTKDYCEVIFLRHGDLISPTQSTTGLICKWEEPEVQVNSSAADANPTTSTQFDGVPETSADVEIKEKYYDNNEIAVSATQVKSQQSRATPKPSNQRSLIVQETPTAARVIGPTDFSAAIKIERNESELVETILSIETADQMEADEAFSTAHTGDSQDKESVDATKRPSRHKKMDVALKTSKKRFSPAVEEAEERTAGRSSKRTKTVVSSQDNTQESHASNTVVDTLRRASPTTKGTKRAFEDSEIAEAIPTRSQRSLQRSATTTTEPYTGPTPCLALSNSSIAKSSQAVKFLKKQGGALVDSIHDHFNILW